VLLGAPLLLPLLVPLLLLPLLLLPLLRLPLLLLPLLLLSLLLLPLLLLRPAALLGCLLLFPLLLVLLGVPTALLQLLLGWALLRIDITDLIIIQRRSGHSATTTPAPRHACRQVSDSRAQTGRTRPTWRGGPMATKALLRVLEGDSGLCFTYCTACCADNKSQPGGGTNRNRCRSL
jgi:hypothetical protein